MQTLLSLLLVASLILLLIGLASPKASLFWCKKEPTKGKSFRIYGLILLVCFILIVRSVWESDTPPINDTDKYLEAAKENVIAQSYVIPEPPPEEEKLAPYTIGDVIEVGNFVYQVNAIKFSKTVGNEFARKTADGVFLIVDLSITNKDNEPHTLDNSFFKLTDENETEFESSTEGETALEMSGTETLFLKKFNPTIKKRGVLIFEVPNEKAFDLHLSGGFWNGNTAIVNLTN